MKLFWYSDYFWVCLRDRCFKELRCIILLKNFEIILKISQILDRQLLQPKNYWSFFWACQIFYRYLGLFRRKLSKDFYNFTKNILHAGLHRNMLEDRMPEFNWFSVNGLAINPSMSGIFFILYITKNCFINHIWDCVNHRITMIISTNSYYNRCNIMLLLLMVVSTMVHDWFNHDHMVNGHISNHHRWSESIIQLKDRYNCPCDVKISANLTL